MYRYDDIDATIVAERVAQFRDQTRRFLDGKLPEEEFRPLRLRNGLYIQRHAPMLRVAIPYGLLSTRQMRMLAHLARKYDRDYGHFTTRQNIQYNWPKLEDVPDMLADLASVEMHAIQTSGNCIRNTTADHFAGIAPDEVEDPRPYCEIIRQWSTLHPEFSYLPRKFKIAVTGSPADRAASEVHDIGLHMKRDAQGNVGFEVLVGGGLGRTPILGKVIRDFLPREQLFSYLTAILRIYNLHGRRDNIYKARIKILVHDLGAEAFAAQVEEEWRRIRDGALKLPQEEIKRIEAYFAPPAFDERPVDALHPALAPCQRKLAARPRRAREEHHTRCPASEAMHRRRLGKALAHSREQGVLEKPSGGDRRQAARLGDGEHVGVARENREVERHLRLPPRRPLPDEPLSGMEAFLGPHARAIEPDLALQRAPDAD